MSTITTFDQRLEALVKATLPGIARLSNPYDVEDNTEVFLKDGFGIAYRDADGEPMGSSCVSISRNIDLILTRKVYSNESDAAKRADESLKLLENQILILRAIEADATFGGLILRMQFRSDPGVEFVSSNKRNYLKIETSFLVRYVESVV